VSRTDRTDRTDVADLLAQLKLHAEVAQRKRAKIELERTNPAALAAVMSVWKSVIGFDDLKFSKQLAVLEKTNTVDVVAFARAVMRHSGNKVGLHFLCGQADDIARQALQNAVDTDGNLNLSGYKVAPGALRDIEGLLHLDLSYCGFRAVPPVLFDLKALQSLNLDGNPLAELPSGMAHCRRSPRWLCASRS
jgi:hypothetical protein